MIGKSDDWKNGEKFRENKNQMKEGMVRMEENWSQVTSRCQEWVGGESERAVKDDY